MLVFKVSYNINLIMKMPLKTAWTLSKLNRIVFIVFEETMKIGKDGSWLNLVRMDQQFKDFSSYMDRIGDDNNFGHIIEIWCLVNATFDSEEFCFSVCNMNRIVDHLYNQSVVHMCMWYQCSNIILDAHIWSYDGSRREWRLFYQVDGCNIYCFFLCHRHWKKNNLKNCQLFYIQEKILNEEEKKMRNFC